MKIQERKKREKGLIKIKTAKQHKTKAREKESNGKQKESMNKARNDRNANKGKTK